MKLYLFSISNWRKNPVFYMEELEATEKNKTYMAKSKSGTRRINKSEIGIAAGYKNSDCMLTENNPSEAAKILIESKEAEIEQLKSEIDMKVRAIETLKKYIKP